MSGYSILTLNVSFPTVGDRRCRALSGNSESGIHSPMLVLAVQVPSRDLRVVSGSLLLSGFLIT